MWTGQDEPTRRAEDPSPRRFDELDADERDADRERVEEVDVDDTLEEEGYGHGV